MRFEAPAFLLLLFIVPLLLWRMQSQTARRPAVLWGRNAKGWGLGAGWLLGLASAVVLLGRRRTAC